MTEVDEYFPRLYNIKDKRVHKTHYNQCLIKKKSSGCNLFFCILFEGSPNP